MTRTEAEDRCMELNRARPADDLRHWIAREGEGGAWGLVSVRVPGLVPGRPYNATTEARPRPPQADDPRSNVVRDVGGPYSGS